MKIFQALRSSKFYDTALKYANFALKLKFLMRAICDFFFYKVQDHLTHYGQNICEKLKL